MSVGSLFAKAESSVVGLSTTGREGGLRQRWCEQIVVESVERMDAGALDHPNGFNHVLQCVYPHFSNVSKIRCLMYHI